MKVLVTGGSGFVGRNLKLKYPDWIYISSKDYNLLDIRKTYEMLESHKPDVVLHLASVVGGIIYNTSNQSQFFEENTLINYNVLKASKEYGIKRLIASLSTCVFPDKINNYPFAEEELWNGPPVKSNFAYGMTKRHLWTQLLTYRQEYGLDYTAFCPSNLYGPHDNFHDTKSHFVPALIKKVLNTQSNTLTFFGTGTELRQQLYIDDLVTIIPKLIHKHHNDYPIIVAPDENLSIKDMVLSLLDILGIKKEIVFNGEFAGQYRKDGSNNRLKELIGQFDFTTFKNGITKTYEWYKNSNN